MTGIKNGNDRGGGFEEDSGSEVVNTGWWLAPVEMPLFDGRHAPNPVAAFPESGVQVPAAIKLDRGVVAIAIFFRKHAAGDRTIFARKLVPFIEDRIRDPKPMRRERACFLVKSVPLWGCCRDGLRKDEVHCMVTDGGGSPCLPESMAPVVATSVAIIRHPWCSSQPGDYSLGKEGQLGEKFTSFLSGI